MIERVTKRGQGCDGAWLRPRDFVLRQRFVVSRQDFTELFRDRVFYVMTECGQYQRALCYDTSFCVVTELIKAMSFYVATEFGLGQGFCVAIEYFMSQQSMAK